VVIEHDPRVSITVTAPCADWQHIEGVSLAGITGEVTWVQEKALLGTAPPHKSVTDMRSEYYW
jgi:hypothetical protein